jgi:hypothetical protein
LGKGKIVYVAHDVAPSECFELIAPIVTESGEFSGQKILVNHGRPVQRFSTHLHTAIQGASFVLIGISSSQNAARMEIGAARLARKLGIPYGFYADTPRAVLQAKEGGWLHVFADDASLVIGLLPNNSSEQTRVFFPNALCIHTGNPVRDAKAIRTFSREEVKDKLGLGSYQHVILAPGGKFTAVNCAIWSLLIDTLSYMSDRHTYAVVLAPHKGDPVVYSHGRASLGVYEEIVRNSPVATTLLKGSDGITTFDALMAADLVVYFNGSVGIEAALHLIPVISVRTRLGEEQLAQENDGDRSVEVVARNAAITVGMDRSLLASHITALLDDRSDTKRSLIVNQRASYPIPVPGEAVQKIVSALGLVRQKKKR